MGRNIVLFSDGTGNKGGTGADTNVFRLYHAIKGKPNQRDQFAFYDNGVGTSSHAVFRAIGGATGFGLRQNVRDLYEFAGRHVQDPDVDDIYGFGFSRGAATIRAFAGMVRHCGLVLKNPSNGESLTEAEFQLQIKRAMVKYTRRGGRFSVGSIWQSLVGWKGPEKTYNVEIEFLGLWDTVKAIGVPQLPWLDAIVNIIRRHKFYDLEPKRTVRNVFHAVAVDDERRTFWPLIWNEKAFMDAWEDKDNPHIEQVWFPGVHSNVGGGYPRPGLANTTLDWMIARLDGHRGSHTGTDRGLALEDSFRDEVRDGVNPYGRLYDSRAGFALLYRFQPRPITEICSKPLEDRGPVRIHSSVLDRMERRTADYGPGQLPDKFVEVVTGAVGAGAARMSTDATRPNLVQPIDMNRSAQAKGNGWRVVRDKISKITAWRILSYWAFLLTTIALLAVSFYFWVGDEQKCGDGECSTSWLLVQVADILHYFLPDYFSNIITFGVLKQPWWASGLLVVVIVNYVVRQRFKRMSVQVCDRARVLVLERAART